ncbi:universal stress protein UspF [Escherichia coli]|uniref:universal stress protein UspF n=1 Tax=Escherichia coli TaxID=562 RepID=UPI003CCA055D
MTALTAEFTVGEGKLMTHDEPCSMAPDDKHDLISGTCSHLPYASLGLAYSAELPAMDDLKAEAKSQLEEIIKKFKLPTDRVHVHVEEGSPKDRILELAKKIPAHMIIIASHRPDITTYLLGSNAAAVVRHAECSVLVVR